jgi:hypothetical protein
MKKVGFFGLLALVLVVVLAITIAGKMGKTSHAYARGQIVVAPELAQVAQGIQTLFVIVSGTEMPMPYAAVRRTLKTSLADEPYRLILTDENVQKMREMELWPAQFKLKARLDRDGVAGPDQPGDLVGEVPLVNAGDQNVVITIDRVVP